jgi:hypothetical protein
MNVNEQGLNTMSPNEFENEVEEQPIMSGLVVKEISRNSLVEISRTYAIEAFHRKKKKTLTYAV